MISRLDGTAALVTGASAPRQLGRTGERGTVNVADRERVGVLFERHARSVYNHCFRRTASWADAEELTSAVFVEAWRRRRDVRPIGESARPWLLGVANNLLRNHRRCLGRYRAVLARLPSPGPHPDPADDVAGRLAQGREISRVLALVARLPRRDQEVLA